MEKILVRKLNHANLHVQCDSGTAQELREFFSFYVPGYRFMPAYKNRMWDGKIRLYDAKTGELPAGLFYHLHKFSKSRGYIVDTEKQNMVYRTKMLISILNNFPTILTISVYLFVLIHISYQAFKKD